MKVNKIFQKKKKINIYEGKDRKKGKKKKEICKQNEF